MSLSRGDERKLAIGRLNVIGIDEAGRGPLAGPVVAAAAWIHDKVVLPHIKDSKQTTEEEREEAYAKIIEIANSGQILYGIGIIDHKEIDKINILQASLKAMRVACNDLLTKCNNSMKSKKTSLPFSESNTTILVDGNKIPTDMPFTTNCVIKGDTYVYSIAVASIIAKVTRDRIMVEYDAQYPAYNFKQHKGYPTFAHRTAISEVGPCPIHRLTYGPVKKYAHLIPASSGSGSGKKSGKGKKSETAVLATSSSSSTSNNDQEDPVGEPVRGSRKRKAVTSLSTSPVSSSSSKRVKKASPPVADCTPVSRGKSPRRTVTTEEVIPETVTVPGRKSRTASAAAIPVKKAVKAVRATKVTKPVKPIKISKPKTATSKTKSKSQSGEASVYEERNAALISSLIQVISNITVLANESKSKAKGKGKSDVKAKCETKAKSSAGSSAKASRQKTPK